MKRHAYQERAYEVRLRAAIADARRMRIDWVTRLPNPYFGRLLRSFICGECSLWRRAKVHR